MDIVKQNRVTRKKLRKQVKLQAQRREQLQKEKDNEIANLKAQLSQALKKNSDCAQLLTVVVQEILDCVNNSEFLPNTYTQFDLGFMKMSYSDTNGFSIRDLRLPDIGDVGQ
jgi:superfamily II RNA helicase